jgi:hypothetical protein
MKKDDYLKSYLLLRKYDLSYEEVVKIMDECSFYRVEDNSLITILDNGFKYLLDKGYSLGEIKKMVNLYSRCLITSDNKRKKIEDAFLELGMTFDEFKSMSIKCGNIYAYRVLWHTGVFDAVMIGLWIGLGLLSIALSVVISSGIYFFGRVFVRADKPRPRSRVQKPDSSGKAIPEIFPKSLRYLTFSPISCIL